MEVRRGDGEMMTINRVRAHQRKGKGVGMDNRRWIR
jgi:hypothetical protein